MNHMQMPMQVHGARPPFTPSQWQELEHQALIFKYMMAGIPVPTDLLIPIRKSLEAITAGLYHHHQPPDMPWSAFHLGFGKNCDPEPGRCRRTDGKKWRCSKDAFPDSKYCERHMHRGRNRSRKPVETVPHSSHSSSLSLSTANRTSSNNTNNNSASTLTSITNNSHTQNLSFASNPYSAPSRLAAAGGIVQPSTVNTNINHFNLDSGSFAIPSKDYRYMKGDIDEHIFFSSEVPGTSRGLGMESLDNGWRSMHQQPPSKLNPSALFNASPTFPKQHHQHSFLNSSFGGITTNNGNNNNKMEEQEQEQPLRHFFDDWPARSRDSSNLSWCDLEEERSNRNSSTTQLSISIPIASSDFSASNSRSPTS